MGTLYIVATPIGNLDDVSERARATLASVDVVLCEDTRVTKRLLDRLEVNTRTMSYHQHSGQMKEKHVIDMLSEGQNLALVTDAGTPAISDPGGKLVEAVVAQLGSEVVITPIPGPSAVVTALSVSGFPADRFEFRGFPPHKKGRKTYFDEVCGVQGTIVFYESTHRIMKALAEIAERVPDRKMVVCRELTKLHETIYRGTAAEVTEQLESTSIKGEFVVVLGPQ
jgi:16S rRNA (cytidine1402-2'-O)-methyltransferase